MKVRTLLVSLFTAALLIVPQAAAERILSLAGEATEIIFALGAEDQIMAVDATSNYPEAVADLPNIGFYGRLSAEALLAFEPTLAIVNNQAGPAEVLEQLEASGVKVVHLDDDPTLETPINNIRLIADLLGEQERGEELAADVQAQLDSARERGAALDPKPRVLFLYLGSQTMQFVGGTGVSTHALIEAAGGVDVGAELGFTGYQPFTPEAIAASEADVIVVTDRGVAAVGSIDDILAIPGVAETPAARSGTILVYEDAYFINLGVRTGAALNEFVDDLSALQ